MERLACAVESTGKPQDSAGSTGYSVIASPAGPSQRTPGAMNSTPRRGGEAFGTGQPKLKDNDQ